MLLIPEYYIAPKSFSETLSNLPKIFTPIHNYFRGVCVGMLDDIYGIQTLNNVTNLLSLKDNGFDMSTYWDIINKTVNAAVRQIEDIRYLEAVKGIEKL